MTFDAIGIAGTGLNVHRKWLDALSDKTEQSLIQTGRTWVPASEYVSLAPFAQLNLALLDERLRLAGGLRWQNDKLKVDDELKELLLAPAEISNRVF